MNVDELLRDVLREEASRQAAAAPDFADTVLAARRRSRTRKLVTAMAAAVVVFTVGAAAPQLNSETHTPPAASRSLPVESISAHPDQWPPRDMIAAGRTAMVAYYAENVEVLSDKSGVLARTYWLLDPKTRKYEKDERWSFVAVSRGRTTAAVLERDLPAQRIGLLDLASGKVERWIPVSRGVGGLAFSPDGTKLVATTYDEQPDARHRVENRTLEGKRVSGWNSEFGNSSRSGFYVFDVASGEGSWSRVVSDANINARQDFAFARDGRTVYSQVIGGTDGMQQFRDLQGNLVAGPKNERYLRSDINARLSPDGSRAALGLDAETKGKSWSEIRDPHNNKKIARVRGSELLTWVDDRRLIAWEKEAGQGRRLVVVTVGSDEVVPLSGVWDRGVAAPALWWHPVFAE
ncbi:WD40 repeat domain-containing protein [Streptomyces sp. NPDC008343]|uniref:WD40 repeat domain-containing protein n=1 Tax=Streptomyces sp. NPDC008343 TaxID=3364828 RepID=UPI0036E8E0DC